MAKKQMGKKKRSRMEWCKLSVLNNQLQARLEDGLYQCYKLDPKGPETPPESIWPLIDRIDMGHTALVQATGCIIMVLEDERRGKEFGVEELEQFGLTIEQIGASIDRMVSRGRGLEEVFMLSALLEEKLGEGWDMTAVQRVKNLLQSHLS